MEPDVIDALAKALADARFETYPGDREGRAALDNATVKIACVINGEEPTYDLRYFYRAAEHPEPYPEHEMAP